jgi:hypothetical protein
LKVLSCQIIQPEGMKKFTIENDKLKNLMGKKWRYLIEKKFVNSYIGNIHLNCTSNGRK